MLIVQTKDIDDSFFPRLREVAAALGAQPRDMLAVMYSESGVHHDAWNDNPKSLPPEKRWNASGINQLMPQFMPGLGWTAGHAAYRQLSATQQLDFVERYFRPHRGFLGTVGGLYTANFLPALVSHAGDRNFVLTAKRGPLPWAFAPNSSFDANKDLAITVGELEDAVERNAKGARWAELVARLEGGEVLASDELVSEGFDLRTTIGIQRALDRLGFAPGPIDGVPGPKTRRAVAAFQSAVGGLDVDGIVGPNTRAALEIELQTRA